MSKAKVYFTKEITPESLIKVYDALGRELKGKTCVKLSSGEPGGHYFLNPNLIKNLVTKLNATIVEGLTAYGGKRMQLKDGWQTMEDHGFKAIAPCDILDEEGEVKLPIEGGKHLQGYDIVGSHIKNYDSTLVLSHFKGHVAGGFGGALKNMSIGFASSGGKTWIHTAGVSKDPKEFFEKHGKQDDFLESMAEACYAIIHYFKPENMAFINVANNLSIDCDCDANPAPPELADIGIFGSLDPVAIDQACYDAVVNSPDPGKKALCERMEKQHAIHIVEESVRLGLGTREYEIINLD